MTIYGAESHGAYSKPTERGSGKNFSQYTYFPPINRTPKSFVSKKISSRVKRKHNIAEATVKSPKDPRQLSWIKLEKNPGVSTKLACDSKPKKSQHPKERAPKAGSLPPKKIEIVEEEVEEETVEEIPIVFEEEEKTHLMILKDRQIHQIIGNGTYDDTAASQTTLRDWSLERTNKASTLYHLYYTADYGMLAEKAYTTMDPENPEKTYDPYVAHFVVREDAEPGYISTSVSPPPSLPYEDGIPPAIGTVAMVRVDIKGLANEQRIHEESPEAEAQERMRARAREKDAEVEAKREEEGEEGGAKEDEEVIDRRGLATNADPFADELRYTAVQRAPPPHSWSDGTWCTCKVEARHVHRFYGIVYEIVLDGEGETKWRESIAEMEGEVKEAKAKKRGKGKGKGRGKKGRKGSMSHKGSHKPVTGTERTRLRVYADRIGQTIRWQNTLEFRKMAIGKPKGDHEHKAMAGVLSPELDMQVATGFHRALMSKEDAATAFSKLYIGDDGEDGGDAEGGAKTAPFTPTPWRNFQHTQEEDVKRRRGAEGEEWRGILHQQKLAEGRRRDELRKKGKTDEEITQLFEDEKQRHEEAMNQMLEMQVKNMEKQDQADDRHKRTSLAQHKQIVAVPIQALARGYLVRKLHGRHARS
jgi:hypothetical protein